MAEVSIDLDAGVLHGEVINAQSVLTFSATEVGRLEAEFQDTIEDYLDWCRERGVEPAKPYSGTLSLRIAPELHRLVAVTAALSRVSVNTFITRVLEKATEAGADRLVLDGGSVWESARPKLSVEAEQSSPSIEEGAETRILSKSFVRQLH